MQDLITNQVDFVITWLDGDDPQWQRNAMQYLVSGYKKESFENDSCRFRDWGLLKYWFRAVEENAPWVRMVHVVTNGQVPSFLDTSHPKVNMVFHQDFMPPEHLPTFNSVSIQVNLHRIPGLAEQFVLFDDDMFINRKISPSFYFSRSKPCYTFIDRRPPEKPPVNAYRQIIRNSMAAVRRHLTPKDAPLFKRVNLKYGKSSIKTFLYHLSHGQYGQFVDYHVPYPFLKSTFSDVWATEPELLYKTSGSRFRSYSDVNQYIFRYWDLARGNFTPSRQEGRNFTVRTKNLDDCVNEILEGNYPQICLNDTESMDDFILCRDRIRNAFEKRYPRMSSFEKKEG